jgi:hypothetical protein
MKSRTGSRYGSGGASRSAYFLLEAKLAEVEAEADSEALSVEAEAEGLKYLVLLHH